MPSHFSNLTDGSVEPFPLDSHNSAPSIALESFRPRKTLDFGSDGLVCSIGILGDIIALSVYHPEHGIIAANPFHQFPGGDKFWDSSFVRAYRKQFIDYFKQPGSGFGVRIPGIKTNMTPKLTDGRWPTITYETEGLKAEVAFAITQGPSPLLINRLIIFNDTNEPKTAEVDLSGQVSINRASYGQLTEAGPVPIPACLNQSRYHEGIVLIENPNLPATLACALYLDGNRIILNGPCETSADPVSFNHTIRLEIPPYAKREVMGYMTLQPTLGAKQLSSRLKFGHMPVLQPPSGFMLNDTKNSTSVERFVIRRTLDYLLSCCCIPIDGESVCVLTDHIALPLGWHRDNYWQMNFLRIVKEHADRLFSPAAVCRWVKVLDRVLYGHLLWIFEHAERTEGGFWGRSYLANGKLKDKCVFQLDQQCYPLLELAEYLDANKLTPSQLSKWGRIVDEILEILLSKRASDKWVFQTSETPGDDPVEMEYHFSSNILLWHALRQLARYAKELCLTNPIAEWVDKIHRDTLNAFTTTHNGQPIFAYLTDLNGSFDVYHDANDLPSVLASKWSFCSSEDIRWRNLFRFAFSPENTRAYFARGGFSGLGSVHTKHPWPLGDAQDMIYAWEIRDKGKFEDAKVRTLKKMQWDGAFAEANDEETGEVRSKHWFSWPGCVIGSVLIEQIG